MGFEELAALKQQLSKRMQAAKQNTGETVKAEGQAQQPGQATASKAPRTHASKSQQTHAKTGQSGNPTHRRTPDNKPGKPAGKPHAPRADGRQGDRPAAARTHAGRPPQTASNARPEKRQSPPVEPVVIIIGQLQKRFPKAFPKNPAPKVPLKLGISKDILAQAEAMSLTEAELLEAIKVWCQGSRYWASMTKGAARVDLNGEPEGLVTPEQAARARSLSAAQRRGKRPAPKKAAEGAEAAAGAADAATEATPPSADATEKPAESASVAEAPHASSASSAPSAPASSEVPATVTASDTDKVD